MNEIEKIVQSEIDSIKLEGETWIIVEGSKKKHNPHNGYEVFGTGTLGHSAGCTFSSDPEDPYIKQGVQWVADTIRKEKYT